MSLNEQIRARLAGRSLVAGHRVEPRGGSFAPASTPGGPELGFTYAAASEADIDAAAREAGACAAAFRDSARESRAAMLTYAAEEIAALGDGLIEVASAETGLARPRLAGERDRTVYQLRMFAEIVREGSWAEAVIDRGDASRQPLPKPDVRRMLRPLGAVAVFGASNFPLAYSVAGGDTASALAAGCPVIVKGHSSHPATGELVALAVSGAVARAGVPAGAFSFLHAGGERDVAVGVELLSHPSIAAGGFTGSPGAGVALARLAAGRACPIPFFAEMGSINPVVVMPGALERRGDEIAAKLAASFTNSAGQMCTCPGLVLGVAGPARENFVQRLSVGAGATAAQPMLSARIRDAWRSGVRESEAAGASLVTGGGEWGASGEAAVVLRADAAAFRASARLREECFGPSTLVVSCASVAEMMECAALVGGALTATLWAEPGEEVGAVVGALESIAGRVVFNGVPTGVEVCDAMVHSGPFPACNRADSTAVGRFAMRRWCRPVAYQNCPDPLLPAELRESNPLGIGRRVNGRWSE
ncbi:MAG: aldehyde dehydrogenase (NADP(+)) [Phycisphaerales bacterium]